MPEVKHIPNSLSKKLKSLIDRKNMTITELDDDPKFNLSKSTLEKLLSGATQKPSTTTIRSLSKYFDCSIDWLTEDFVQPNYHIRKLTGENVNILKNEFGPAIDQALRLGKKVTTWVNRDFTPVRYKPENIRARLLDISVEDLLPRDFKLARDNVVAENTRKLNRGENGFADNETVAFTKLALNMAEDVYESPILDMEFRRSRYANNKTAKDKEGAIVRSNALKNFHYDDQPITFLSSGVGLALLLFTDGGKSIILTQRSRYETFRSLEFDVSVVEGIKPSDDCVNGKIDFYGAAVRGFKEELNVDLNKEDINLFSFGVDLEYYQWNMLGCATTSLSSEEVINLWHGAKDRKESADVFAVEANPYAVLSFCLENKIWSSGIASIYYSFLWRDDEHLELLDICNRLTNS